MNHRNLVGSIAAALTFFAVGLPAASVAAPGDVIYRVNAGGPQITATPNWSADTGASPSPYLEPGTQIAGTSNPINMTHSSLPSGTPEALFKKERYDPKASPEMQWNFPVTAGQYEVRLYFAETWSGGQSVGARVFDVSIENALVLDNYDVFADVGGYKGVMKSFTVTTDSNIDIDFGHVVENPKINGIEILEAGTQTSTQLGATPSSADFGSVTVGTSVTKSVQLVHLGGTGSPNIIVDATNITGTNPGQFSDNFNDAGDVTLAPGQSTTVDVTFSPTSSGTKTATLSVTHSGSNSPLSIPLSGSGIDSNPTGTWESRAPSGPNRQEVSYVAAGGKFYLAGGGTAHEVYDPLTDKWSNVAPLPQSLDHIQGVEVGGLIYYIGGLSSWPGPHVSTVYIYDPQANTFSQGTPMPRGRGAGGVAVYQGKIYYAGGLHNGAAVAWFDVYDPATDSWTQLPDMPRKRDHFHAAVVNGKFYAIGGRDTAIDATTSANDVYTFSTGTWSSAQAPLPTPRGGFAAAVLDDEILIIGGEGGGTAHAEVEAYNTVTNSWRTLTPMPVARHGIQAAVCNGGVYIAAGGTVQGGGGATDVHHVFFLNGPTTCGQQPTPIGFGKSSLQGESSNTPTSLQWGPDGRLYVGQFNGLINVYEVVRNSANSYSVTATETITSVKSIPNHDDDGSLNTSQINRLLTGILVTGTASNPVIYATSSDPRIGAGPDGTDLNLDTNSGIISRLTWNGTSWTKLDLVRGLPRSEENHTANGMALDTSTNMLYVAQGGNTNKGAPSNNFALLPEFALSAAILSVDLDGIGNSTYDLPTLDDETRAGNPDSNDPFGGNDGKNQAKLVSGGPVQVFAPGFRNAYDVLLTQSGTMYTIDNGGNAGWGDVPVGEGSGGTCTNDINEPGTSDPDHLHLISGAGYYGGHPNPTRANTNNKFNSSNPQSPVATGNAVECDYRSPSQNGSLTTFPSSTNGLDEYTTSNFNGAMSGDIVAAGYVDNVVYRVTLNSAGTQVVQNEALFSTVGLHPLDVAIPGTGEPFPGTIWVADTNGTIHVFEPNDFGGGGGGTCSGADDPAIDEDGDGFDNADEIDNGTNPCSSADVPPDWDGDFTSNLNDPDDDNDGLPDTADPFAVDPDNGLSTNLPVSYTWENDAPNPGGILNLGFTGLMSNGSANYESLYDSANMTAGGAAGVVTVDLVPSGDCFRTGNTQKYGFQFGVAPPASGTFTAHTRIVAPFSGLTPENYQSMGLFVGTGDQDNYVKLVTSANSGAGGIQFVKEVAAGVNERPQQSVAMPGPDYVDLYLTIDVGAATVQPSYSVTTGGVTGGRINYGSPAPMPTSWISGGSGLAVGILSTSVGPGPEFPATWDFMEVVTGLG